MADENHAIVVGLNHYPGITPLEGPENDAIWFHDWLLKNGLVDKDRATLILSSAFAPPAAQSLDAMPDTGAIDRAFERLLRIGVQDDRVGKRLYLFFSGHGFGPDLDEAALLMANCEASIGITGHYINAVQYANFFAKAAYFDEIVLFMDCCRDDLWQAPPRQAPWQRSPNPDGADVKRFYGLATKWARKAREAAPPGGGPVHGHFTRALKAAFEGGAVDQNKDLTTGSVRAFCLSWVQSVLKPELAAQNAPVPEPQFVQKDDFVLARGLATGLTTVTVTFKPASQAAKAGYTLLGGKPQKLVANDTGANPWVHHLDFGHYSIFDPAGNQVAEFDTLGVDVPLNV